MSNNGLNEALQLKNYIQKIASKMLENYLYSGVEVGIISGINADGTYQVQIKQAEATSTVTASKNSAIDIKLQEGDQVYLIYYKNNSEDNPVYCIYDSVVNAEQKFRNLTVDELFMKDDQLQKFTMPSNEEIGLVYVLGEKSQNEDIYITKIKEKGTFRIEAKFSSNEDTDDDFGLMIEFLTEDTKAFKKVYLNPPYFLGQPKNLSDKVTQSRVIVLEEEDKKQLAYLRFSTYGNGFDYSDVTLVCGSLLNIQSQLSAVITVDNNKNYFSPNEYKDSVTLTASVYQEGSKQTSSSLSYYWVIEDKNNIDRTGYPGVIEEGWRILNSYVDEQIIGGENDGNTVRVWSKTSPTLTIEEGGTLEQLFPNFLNKVKCIVTYRSLKVDSNSVDIYNYYHPHFSAKINTDQSPSYLLYTDDKIAVTCTIGLLEGVDNIKDNVQISDYNYQYSWKINDIDYNFLDEQGDIMNTAVIYIRDSGSPSIDNYYELAENEKAVKIACTVKITKKNFEGQDIEVDTLNTNEVTVTSFIQDENLLVSNKEFKYYISKGNMSVFFQQEPSVPKEGEESVWTGDWIIRDKANADATWSLLALENNETEYDGYNKIYGNNFEIFDELEKNSNNNYYVYYTERTMTYQNGDIIRTENWITPKLGRVVSYDVSKGGWHNLEKDIEQINIFNTLTNYGSLEGIQYDGSDAFINASFINTGVLRVGDNGNEKFYADINGNTGVKIAGFIVDESSLQASIPQEEEENFDIYLGKKGLKVGNFLQVGPTGASISGDVSVSGSAGGSTTLNELNEKIIIYGERRNIVVYSASETRPNVKPYRDTEKNQTNIGETFADNATWFEQFDESKVMWMCQKYDISLEDNDNVAWGDIIQVTSAKSYTIEIDNDFIAVPANSAGGIDENWNAVATVTIKKGLEDYDLPDSIAPGAPTDEDERLGYEASNVTVKYDSENKNFKITKLTADSGRIWFKFYKFKQIQATATIELIKQKAGSSGGVPSIGPNGNWYVDGVDTGVAAKGQDGSDGETPEIKNGYWYIGDVSLGVKAQGTDGVYVYIDTSLGSIKKDSEGKLITKSVPITAYKKVGDAAATVYTQPYYMGVQADAGKVEWLTDTVILNSYEYEIKSDPKEKLTFYFSIYDHTTDIEKLTDKIILNVVQDGQTGRSVGFIEEYYRISNETNTDDTYNTYSTNMPSFNQEDLENGRTCIWNYEISKDIDGKEISKTDPVLLFKYAFDGTNGTNGEDGISIESITEYYKLYATVQEFSEAPSKDELNKEWNATAGSLTSEDSPFKYNCEMITFDKDREPIITMPQLVAEHPKTVYFIYSSSESQPTQPNAGEVGNWDTTLQSDTKWKCEKVDYGIEGTVAWSEPYQIVANDGVSPYLLSIDNDFIAIPCDSEGQLIDEDFSEIFNVSLYQGDKVYNLTNNEEIKVSAINGFAADIIEGSNYQYALTNFVFEEGKDRGTILVELVRDESIILASSTIEIIKQKQGNKGDTGDTGEAGSYVYALANTNTISVNENGKLKSTDGTETISIGVYKRSGSSAPIFDTDNYYAVSFENNQGDKHLYSGRKADPKKTDSENAFTCKIGDKNSSSSAQLQTPTLNLTISIYQVSAANESLMNNPNAILIDRIVLNVVKDGATGSQGAAAPTLQIVYQAAETAPNKPTENKYPPSDWHVSEPALADGERLYMSQKMSDEDESAWSVPIPISALDGAAGKDGSDIKYIYRRSATPLSGNDLTPGGSGGDVNLPSNWTDSPQGVTEEYLYEYVSISSKSAGDEDWSSYSTAVIWSKWGEKGQDGDGIEYRYRVFTDIQNFQTALTDEEIADWTDEPIGVNESNKYEYICQRKYNGDTQTYTNSIPKLWNEWKEVEVPEAIPGRNPLQSVFYYVWSADKINPPNTDTLIQDVTDNNYYAWSDDFSSITFQTHEEWAPEEQDPVYWALEEDLFTHWSGREVSTTYITSNTNLDLGKATYVWKIQVTAYDNGTIGIWSNPVLMPELEAIELAAKYQIKNDTYVKSFARVETVGEENYRYTYPIYHDSAINAPEEVRHIYSITGNLLTAISTTNARDERTDPAPETRFIGNIPEGDIGRWCQLYDRTVISGGAIVTGSITADQIATNTITAAQIAAGTITANQIAANTITAAQIATRTITADKIKVNDLSALQATIGGWEIEQTQLISQNHKIILNSDENNPIGFALGDETFAFNEVLLNEGLGKILGYVSVTQSNSFASSGQGSEFEIIDWYENGDKKYIKLNNDTNEAWEYQGSLDIQDWFTEEVEEVLSNIFSFNDLCWRSEVDPSTLVITSSDILQTYPLLLSKNGSLYASDATIEGTIIADAGMIGAWEITPQGALGAHFINNEDDSIIHGYVYLNKTAIGCGFQFKETPLNEIDLSSLYPTLDINYTQRQATIDLFYYSVDEKKETFTRRWRTSLSADGIDIIRYSDTELNIPAVSNQIVSTRLWLIGEESKTESGNRVIEENIALFNTFDNKFSFPYPGIIAFKEEWYWKLGQLVSEKTSIDAALIGRWHIQNFGNIQSALIIDPEAQIILGEKPAVSGTLTVIDRDGDAQTALEIVITNGIITSVKPTSSFHDSPDDKYYARYYWNGK